MAAEAGFDVRLQSTEFATAIAAAVRGEFEAFLLGWSGRADPDGNLVRFAPAKGGRTTAAYCDAEVDRCSTRRARRPTPRRSRLYRQVAGALPDSPTAAHLPLAPQEPVRASSTTLQGFRLVADGLIRRGLRLAN
jgi:peptide/nickel transport system substrate-binding protein